jgi:S1-C subfamily serine protease
MESLQTYLETNYQVGDTVTVVVLREGEEISLEVELTEEPS